MCLYIRTLRISWTTRTTNIEILQETHSPTYSEAHRNYESISGTRNATQRKRTIAVIIRGKNRRRMISLYKEQILGKEY